MFNFKISFVMKKFFLVFMFMMVSVMATAQCNVFLVEPTMRLNFNDREERIKKFQEWCKNTQPENACEKFWRFP